MCPAPSALANDCFWRSGGTRTTESCLNRVHCSREIAHSEPERARQTCFAPNILISMARSVSNSMARKQDILKMAPPKRPPKLTSRRIGIHTSSAGGVHTAAERAYRLGCNTFQMFSSSPRQWAPYELSTNHCDEMSRLREIYKLRPLVIHTNYLINLASTTEHFLKK